VSAGSLAAPGSVLLVSCYELGHQPFTLASPWAQLEAAGFGVAGVDTSLDALADEAIDRARLVAISVPMHTALRLGSAIARRVRAKNPRAHVCLYGLYASLNAEHLLATVADSVIGGEFEASLVELASALAAGQEAPRGASALTGAPVLRRLAFAAPKRDDLPALDRYAKLLGPAPGETRVVGYVEASRGCLHRCLHCPITPVYEGRFFVVPEEIVLADLARQVELGARHVTFGDPDFFNGVNHSMKLARALHASHPNVTFDVTTKVENILKHAARFAELADLGCVFVVSAFESLSDRVLAELEKGHTRADIFAALEVARAARIPVRPSLVPFTPWTTLDDYVALCDFVLAEGLVDHIDPIQLAIRLLLPPGSALLARPAPRPWLGELAAAEFGYRWTHPDPAVDRLHAQVSARVEAGASQEEDPAVTVAAVRALAYAAAGREPRVIEPARRFVPRLTEAWFCCAEPMQTQMEQLTKGCCDGG
jgi:hypothetical protein